MAELGLRERLQPLLLDRLVDDERVLTIFEVTFERRVLRRLGLASGALAEFICAHPDGRGLTLLAAEDEDSQPQVRLRFSAPSGRVSVPSLKALMLKPPGAPEGLQLQAIGTITTREEMNAIVEAGEDRRISMARLRECV